MDFELSAGIRLQIVESELTNLEAEMYRLGLRYAVRERLGKKAEAEQIEKSMEELQDAIGLLREEFEKVKAEMGGKDEDGSNTE